MKQNKTKLYAKALADLMMEKKTSEQEQKIVDNFLKLLEKNRDTGKIKEIIALAEDLFIKKSGRRKVFVETARKIKANPKELLNSILQKGDIVNEKINKDLIAGVKIIINDEQLDLSMQKKLQNIFN
jgi:F0F1-type ATP synthase delta subunit